MSIVNRIKEIYERPNDGYTLSEMCRMLPDAHIGSIGSTLQKLHKRGYLDSEPVKGSKYQARRYFKPGLVKPINYKYLKPAASLLPLV